MCRLDDGHDDDDEEDDDADADDDAHLQRKSKFREREIVMDAICTHLHVLPPAQCDEFG